MPNDVGRIDERNIIRTISCLGRSRSAPSTAKNSPEVQDVRFDSKCTGGAGWGKTKCKRRRQTNLWRTRKVLGFGLRILVGPYLMVNVTAFAAYCTVIRKEVQSTSCWKLTGSCSKLHPSFTLSPIFLQYPLFSVRTLSRIRISLNSMRALCTPRQWRNHWRHIRQMNVLIPNPVSARRRSVKRTIVPPNSLAQLHVYYHVELTSDPWTGVRGVLRRSSLLRNGIRPGGKITWPFGHQWWPDTVDHIWRIFF